MVGAEVGARRGERIQDQVPGLLIHQNVVDLRLLVVGASARVREYVLEMLAKHRVCDCEFAHACPRS